MRLLMNTTSPYACIALAERGRGDVATEMGDAWGDTPSLLDANSAARVPALLTDDGRALTESLLIVHWLESRWPQPSLLGADATATVARDGIAMGIVDAAVHTLIGRKITGASFDESPTDPQDQGNAEISNSHRAAMNRCGERRMVRQHQSIQRRGLGADAEGRRGRRRCGGARRRHRVPRGRLAEHDRERARPAAAVAAIAPWNSPLLLAVWKIAPTLAAGNTIVVKPSEFSSASTLAFAQLVGEAGFPPGVFNVVTGFGAEVGEPLVKPPLVAKVAFIGSDSGGRRGYETAAKDFKRVSLCNC